MNNLTVEKLKVVSKYMSKRTKEEKLENMLENIGGILKYYRKYFKIRR